MKSVMSIVPRYQETDQMGVIHHSVYPIWYEMGRVKFCDDMGMSFKSIEAQGVGLAMVEMTSQFKKPSFFGELYTQYTYLTECSRVKMTFRYELYNSNEELVHIGHTTLAWLGAGFRPQNIMKNHPDIYRLFARVVESGEANEKH